MLVVMVLVLLVIVVVVVLGHRCLPGLSNHRALPVKSHTARRGPGPQASDPQRSRLTSSSTSSP